MADFFFKNWHHFKQIARFVISGGTAAAANLSVLYILTDWFGIWYLFSAVLAYLVSFFISFCLQKFWTFRDKSTERIKKQLVFYSLVIIFGLVSNVVLMYFFVDTLHIWYMFSQVIVGVFLAVCDFLFYKFFVFKQQIDQ